MSENDLQIISWLLSTTPEAEPGAFDSVAHWKQHHEQALLSWTEPADMAIAGGFLAPCPAYAFAVGYWAALHRLLPELPKESVPALCISERHGAHPAKITCRLEKEGTGWRLNGKKHFVTCGNEADLLLVAATSGTDPDGKNRLKLVSVNKEKKGIALKPLEKPIDILPEISHGVVELTNAAVESTDILPGDGYLKYIKPFRTIEDLHVMAAILGYLKRIGKIWAWPAAAREQMIALLLTIRTLARADYSAPEIHIALGGTYTALQSLLETIEPCWDIVEEDINSAWQRDRAVLNIAADARKKRLAAAWRHFE
jgi:alkylation response protein AidB-like acyl-CoA dehydrogenase